MGLVMIQHAAFRCPLSGRHTQSHAGSGGRCVPAVPGAPDAAGRSSHMPLSWSMSVGVLRCYLLASTLSPAVFGA